MNATASPTQTKFIVRISRQGILFHKERFSSKTVYSAAPDHEASHFDSEEDADFIAREQGLSRGQFTIEPYNPQPE